MIVVELGLFLIFDSEYYSSVPRNIFDFEFLPTEFIFDLTRHERLRWEWQFLKLRLMHKKCEKNVFS